MTTVTARTALMSQVTLHISCMMETPVLRSCRGVTVHKSPGSVPGLGVTVKYSGKKTQIHKDMFLFIYFQEIDSSASVKDGHNPLGED